MSNMLNVDLARAMAADRDRHIAARDAAGPAPERASLRDRVAVLLRRARREVAAATPAVPAVAAALTLPEAVALDEVA